MSTFTHESMINHHGKGLLAQLSETFHIWRKRQRDRQRDIERAADRGGVEQTRQRQFSPNGSEYVAR